MHFERGSSSEDFFRLLRTSSPQRKAKFQKTCQYTQSVGIRCSKSKNITLIGCLERLLENSSPEDSVIITVKLSVKVCLLLILPNNNFVNFSKGLDGSVHSSTALFGNLAPITKENDIMMRFREFVLKNASIIGEEKGCPDQAKLCLLFQESFDRNFAMNVICHENQCPVSLV